MRLVAQSKLGRVFLMYVATIQHLNYTEQESKNKNKK